jgi:hypothetical protein
MAANQTQATAIRVEGVTWAVTAIADTIRR